MPSPMTVPPAPIGPEVPAALQQFLEEARARLGDRERDLAAVVGDASTSTAADDEHDPDGSPVSLQRTLAAALVERARADLTAAEAALRRVADGSYGTCEMCGQAIPAPRLSALPTATTCVGCASAPGSLRGPGYSRRV